MATLIRQQECDVLIDYNGFALQDEEDTDLPLPYPEERAELGSGFLNAFESRLDIESAGHTHEAKLVVEVWDGEPPADAREDWEESGESEIFSPSGILAVWVMAGAGEERIELGRADSLWKVRVHSVGRAEVARLADFEVPEGVERYLVQAWPSLK
ncbi:hypothetical protein [Streptomyces sp. SAJ15]|uniref:hypothetical protein n=1 Tax=Streptomyces sp. SAJ15 TaxID=2011095 RepID=UPI001184CCBD|nr:hypothetical protein [Streptomyces sp. SAJ15]